MSDTNSDPILDEVRRIREQVLEECGGTVEGLMDAMRKRDAKAGDTVELPKSPRRPGDDSTGSSETAA